MNLLFKRIHETADKEPQKIAIQGNDISLDYQTLIKQIESVSAALKLTQEGKQQSFAILLDNHPAWAVIDLALLFNRQCSVPLPPFFSIEQLKHALVDSHAEHLILDDSDINTQLMYELRDMFIRRDSISIAGKSLNLLSLHNKFISSEKNIVCKDKIVKITYTSGTTDRPKGVLLSEQAVITKAASLAAASEADEHDVSLSILPLSTLLENIGGLYVRLYCGATSILLSPETIGLKGSSQINQQRLLASIQKYQPTAFIIIPQLLLFLSYYYFSLMHSQKAINYRNQFDLLPWAVRRFPEKFSIWQNNLIFLFMKVMVYLKRYLW